MKVYEKEEMALQTCFHVAGHCFLFWYLGFAIDQAIMDPPHQNAEKTRIDTFSRYTGRLIGAPMVCRSMKGANADPEFLQSWREHEIAVTERYLLMVAAGPMAEAKLQDALDRSIWLQPTCASDYKHLRKIAVKYSLGDPELLIDIACTRANSLLLSSQAAASVPILAQRLYELGKLDGSDIDAVCSKFYNGRRPAYDTWLHIWPPTIAQLSSGFIPLFSDDQEGLGIRMTSLTPVHMGDAWRSPMRLPHRM